MCILKITEITTGGYPNSEDNCAGRHEGESIVLHFNVAQLNASKRKWTAQKLSLFRLGCFFAYQQFSDSLRVHCKNFFSVLQRLRRKVTAESGDSIIHLNLGTKSESRLERAEKNNLKKTQRVEGGRDSKRSSLHHSSSLLFFTWSW